MAQNNIIKGKNNPVSIIFSGVVDLTLYSDISAAFGSDTRTKISNPTSVVVVSASQLDLFFNDTTETGGNFWTIFGIDGSNPDGFELTSECIGNLPKTYVCE
jgi:hypothetical protein